MTTTRTPAPTACRYCGPLKTWRWSSREHAGLRYAADLHLTFEISGDPVVDECYPSEDPAEHVERWARWLHQHCPAELEADAVRISWFITSHTAGVHEEAPGPAATGWSEVFTDIYTTPIDDRGAPIVWSELPVHVRWPLLYEGLGWTPSALQPTAPVRTLLAHVGVH